MAGDAAAGGWEAPVVIFDNRCRLCTGFARAVGLLARGRMATVGHYSDLGQAIRDEILDESALDMFWFVDGRRAYGGRAALVPLARSILSPKRAEGSPRHDGAADGAGASGGCDDGDGDGDGDGSGNDNSGPGCTTPKAVLVRSASLLTNSRVIDIPVRSK